VTRRIHVHGEALKPAAATKNLGKTSFVKEVLFDNPQANTTAVNEAWSAAGTDGAISATLVNKMRAQLGLTGNLRAQPGNTKSVPTSKSATRDKKQGKKAKGKTLGASTETTRAEGSSRRMPRNQALVQVEGEIDRLLFLVMNLGGLTEVEDALRESRRRLYRAL
jgi:hypothetical protein